MNLEEKIYDGIIELKEEMACVKTQFITLNGSVKKHEKKIWWVEKVLWTGFGVFGAVQFYLNYLI